MSLIVAIGSQNTFVLKQGLRNHHLLLVCTICALSDAVLILLGVSGFGAVVKKYPAIEMTARYGGALFLIIYACLNFKSALVDNHALNPKSVPLEAMSKTVLMCLGFTWLNPHVYLDTVVLLGSLSTVHYPAHWWFAFGACTASFVFFFALGFGARVLAPLFENPVVWKYLEFFIGVVMLSIAASLVT